MKSLIILSLLLAGTVSSADIIKCSFTEPFIDTEYSMTTRTLTVTDFAGGDDGNPVKTVTKNVSFQIKGPGSFQLLSEKNVVLQTLTLNYEGSDGMSDTTYPYLVKFNGNNDIYGGCESNFLRKKEDSYNK